MTGDLHFATDTYNWLYHEVDLSLSNYWHSGPTPTTPNQPQVAAATNGPSVAALPAQLAFKAANIQVDCHMASSCFVPADLDFCQADISKFSLRRLVAELISTDPTLPIWAYLALVSISNLHQQFNNMYVSHTQPLRNGRLMNG